ncbi:MAG: DUF3108 domain-containing protein [Pseudomonadota bacterium]
MTARNVLKLASIAVFVACPVSAIAQAESAAFDVTLRGITAAKVRFAANVESNEYAVTGILRPTGLVGAVVDAGYEATSVGRFQSSGGFRPYSFTERRTEDGALSTAEMRYRRGIPQIKTYNPPRDVDPFAVDPSGQGGTVDPMTAIWAALRDRPRDLLCDLDVIVFDGKRRSGVRLANPALQNDGTITCAGEYRRIQGWSPQRLAERSRFPFTMTYAENDSGAWEVVRVTTETKFGRAELRRR